MKSNKGITIISVTIYIIVLTIIMGTMSIMMKFFYRNEKYTTISNDSVSQNLRFLAYITDDVNSRKNKKL